MCTIKRYIFLKSYNQYKVYNLWPKKINKWITWNKQNKLQTHEQVNVYAI